MIAYKALRRKNDRLYSFNTQCVVEYKRGEPTLPYPGSALFVFACQSAAEYFIYRETRLSERKNYEVWEVSYIDENYYSNSTPMGEVANIFWKPCMNGVKPRNTAAQIFVPRGTIFAKSVTLLRKIP